MKQSLILLIFSIILYSCKSGSLQGKTYELNSSEQYIKISFITTDLCEIQQKFYCSRVPDSLKSTVFKAKYDLVKSKIKYKKNNKTKNLKVVFLRLKNLENNFRNLSRYTYIPNYSDLCQESLIVNSKEMKLREKIKPGIILNLINDSLVIKKDTILFGFKKLSKI